MQTWSTLNQKLSYFLDDRPTAGNDYQFPLPLRVEAWNWAQGVFCAHTLRERSTTLTMIADSRKASLPDDFEFVGMIYDANGELAPDYRNIYTQRRFVDGGLRMDTLNYNWAYWIWDNEVNFDKPMSQTISVRMDYFARWPDVTYAIQYDGSVEMVQDQVHIPKWAELPLIHLSASTILQPGAVQAAMSNEFRIKIDAGTPLDNPRAQQAREHVWWYNTLIGFHTPQVKAVGVKSQ
jgi:hypothetical protein